MIKFVIHLRSETSIEVYYDFFQDGDFLWKSSYTFWFADGLLIHIKL